MKILHTPMTESFALRAVAVSFAPNGGSHPDAASNKGDGFSVLRNNAGLWDVTFDESYAEFIGPSGPGLQLNAPDDKSIQFGAWDATTRTLRVVCWDNSGAAATDIVANANNRITFVAWFRDSAVQR